MRGLSQLYGHECIIHGCETNSAVVKLLLELDKLHADHDTIAQQVAELPDFVRRAVPKFVGAEPLELDLSGNYFGDRGLAALGKILLTMTRLRKLSLRTIKMTEGGVSVVCELIAKHPTLEQIDMRGNELFATSGRTLTESLRKHPRLFLLQIDMHAMPSRIARKLAEQIGRNLAAKYPLAMEPEAVDRMQCVSKSGRSAEDVVRELRRVMSITDGEAALVYDMMSSENIEAFETALRCHARCGAFAVQLFADFGLNGAALQALSDVSRRLSTAHFESPSAFDEESRQLLGADSTAFHDVSRADPLQRVLDRVRQLSIVRGLTDPMTVDDAPVIDPDADDVEPMAPPPTAGDMAESEQLAGGEAMRSMLLLEQTASGIAGLHELLKQIVRAKGNRLILHKIEDLHRRLVALRNAIASVEAGHVEVETVASEVEQTLREMTELLVHTWETIATTTIDGAPLMHDFEAATYQEQRFVISEQYEHKRSLLLLCDRCDYFHRSAAGQKSVALAQHRYNACRGSLRAGDAAAFLEEVIRALREPKASERRELNQEIQALLPPSYMRTWVALRLSRALAAWVASRYRSDFSRTTLLGAAQVNPALCAMLHSSAVVAQCVQTGMFYDVPDFPSDLIAGLGAVKDVNGVAVLCRQHAAAARFTFIAENVMPALS